MARAKWVYFDDLPALDAAEVADWLKTAHALVAAKLTRKLRAELGLA
jgi:predicted DNA-binding protein (MmcQ/YjbR family)